MKITFFKGFLIHTVFLTDGSYIAHGNDRGFLHHIAHLTSQVDIPFSRHFVYLDLQRFTAHTGPGKPSDDTRLGMPVCLFLGKLFLAKVLLQIGRCHRNLCFFLSFLSSFQDLPGCFPADIPDLSLKTSDPGFSCVIRDHRFQCTILNG